MGGSASTARPISHPPARARQDVLFTQACTFVSCAVCEQGSWPPVSPSLLPPRHVIPLLKQTPHHRIAVRRVRIERSIRAAD